MPSSSAKRLAGLRQRLGDDAVERLDMGARGDLRHHAAERRMLGDLRQHDVGQDLAAARRRARSTTAAAVSSQVVSMPRTSMGSLLPCRPALREALVAQSSGIILRLGTRGSPLALAQARMVRAALAAAHGLDPGADRARGDPHQRRPHPGPAAGGGRRQGPVHQGDRGGARSPARSISRCIPRRTCRPCCRRAWCCRPSCRARTRATCSSAARRNPSPTCRTARRSAPRRCGGRRWSSACGPISRSCRCAATSRRGCASSTRARSTRRCWRSPA